MLIQNTHYIRGVDGKGVESVGNKQTKWHSDTQLYILAHISKKHSSGLGILSASFALIVILWISRFARQTPTVSKLHSIDNLAIVCHHTIRSTLGVYQQSTHKQTVFTRDRTAICPYVHLGPVQNWNHPSPSEVATIMPMLSNLQCLSKDYNYKDTSTWLQWPAKSTTV